nr:hypothetical protein [Tanacetum cinerariifolium]
MWIQQPIDYNRHALWGVSHWARKRQQFYGYAVNRKSALDVYSKRRIIAVTELKIEHCHQEASGRPSTGSDATRRGLTLRNQTRDPNGVFADHNLEKRRQGQSSDHDPSN